MKVQVSLSVGELLDKITILEIKREKITCPIKLKNIETELSFLNISANLDNSDEIKQCLKEINSHIWDVEDKVRDHERRKVFGTEFIETSRLVYKFNDERARIKYEINKRYDSDIVEEKSYVAY